MATAHNQARLRNQLTRQTNLRTPFSIQTDSSSEWDYRLFAFFERVDPHLRQSCPFGGLNHDFDNLIIRLGYLHDLQAPCSASRTKQVDRFLFFSHQASTSHL